MTTATPIARRGEFLTINPAELQRARLRIDLPEWSAAAAALRAEAGAAVQCWAVLPCFDSAWYDADPRRDFAETYKEFAAYSYGTNHLLGAAHLLLRAGALLGRDDYLDLSRQWMLHVVDHFSYHVQHHDAGLVYAGNADAIAGIHAFLYERLSADERARTERQMIACGEAVLANTRHWLANLHTMPYNNHFAHHRKAMLVLGLVLGGRDWVDLALEGSKNFSDLLVGATVDDGLCYESSTLYHYGTLAGLARIAELVYYQPSLGRDLYRETFANGRCLKQMYDAPLGLLLPNGELPALGDCYARRTALWQSHTAIYERAYAVYGDPRYAWLIRQGGARASVEALVHGVDHIGSAEAPAGGTRLWVEHGYARLASRGGRDYWDRGTVAAVLTGDMSGIHHHKDKPGLIVAAVGRVWIDDVESAAMEQQGFADPIQRAFNRTMLAHNLVVVDEQEQAELATPLAVTEFKDLPACRTVVMADAEGRVVPGVAMSRGVMVTSAYVLDVFQVRSASVHTYDWLIHPRADGAVATGLAFTPTLLPERNPYAMLRQAGVAAVCQSGAVLEWHQGEDRFRTDVSCGQAGELLRAEWPRQGDWATGGREMFMLRIRGLKQLCFVALYQVLDEGTAWRINPVERWYNGVHDEVRVDIQNGKECRRHVLRGLFADERGIAKGGRQED